MFQTCNWLIMNKYGLTAMLIIMPWVLLTTEVNSQDVEEPLALLLTWQYDPTTTMTVDWQTEEDLADDGTIRYRELNERTWRSAEANQ